MTTAWLGVTGQTGQMQFNGPAFSVRTNTSQSGVTDVPCQPPPSPDRHTDRKFAAKRHHLRTDTCAKTSMWSDGLE
jgi:hypothetical protein